MHTTALKFIFAFTACALGADAVADAPALVPVSAEAAQAASRTAEQPVDAPHARILGAVHAQGNVYRQQQPALDQSENHIGTLAECLTLADGWLPTADLSRVHILRAANAGTNTPPAIINFLNYLQRGSSADNVFIYANDTIYVPELSTDSETSVQTVRQIEQYYYTTPYPYPYPQGRPVYIIQNNYRPHPPRPPRPRPGENPRPRPQPAPQPPVFHPKPAPVPRPQPAPQQPAEPNPPRVIPSNPPQVRPAPAVPKSQQPQASETSPFRVMPRNQ